MIENIWYKDLKTFVTLDNLTRFIPTSTMTFPQKLNALMRFSIYFSILVYFVKTDLRVFYFIIFMAALTAFLFEMYDRNRKKTNEMYQRLGWGYDSKLKTPCTLPSKNNPMANILISDYSLNPKRNPGCDINNKKIKNLAEEYFEDNLYRDVDDVWKRKTNSRNYYQTPIQTIPNNQQTFAEWLYKTGPTCKEGNGSKCHKNMYNDLRI